MFTLGIILMLAGGLIVVIEIQSLTIYLMAVALACFVAGTVSMSGHAGLDSTLGVFALVLVAGLPVAHVFRRRLKNPESDQVSHDDAGATVELISASDGLLRVNYRGTQWDAHPVGELPAERLQPGSRLTIVERKGSVLFVDAT